LFLSPSPFAGKESTGGKQIALKKHDTNRCQKSPVLAAALMLHADPQLVHLCKIEQQEFQGIIDVTAVAFIL
jgi:hypothetical protein